ncbi:MULTISPECIES: hypothetical protein [unclassified Fibrobacter]|uniref:hypothetical protein n=1 Tax=unclassified Fibrobacter TaxID=2634177 RepID=UPI000D6C262A|nr:MULTISPECIES: hypothetical protein [unclassified Fibrobacter]PWJ68105.1 hypothetical protein BGX12_11031 [Fibrobacter sp. UWR4]PZW71840.1 hypothetical protein C8E88_100932 [Fibrobacter sp. UWR1]
MKNKTLKFLMSAAVAAFFVGCSSDSHSPSKPKDEAPQSSSSVNIDELLGISSSSVGASGSVDKSSASTAKSSNSNATVSSSSKGSSSVVKPVDTEIVRSACDSKMDDAGFQALDATNSKAFELFKTLGDKQFSDAKDLSAEVKPMYAKILQKYPNSCGAQLGYAVANLVDLINNQEIKKFFDTGDAADEATWLYEGNIKTSKFLKSFANRAGESITINAQNIIATQILPALDTSIAYMQNVLAYDDYTMQFMADGKKRELDKSEFGPAIGAMFGTKAILTILVSLNFEFDDNGSYDWYTYMTDVSLTDVGVHNEKQTNAIKFLASLLGKNGAFSTVNSGWEKQWNSVPALLDSALRETRAGLKYGINESMEEGSQVYDIYVVGDGADADVSVKDLQDAVSAIDVVLNEVLDGPYVIDFGDFRGDLDYQLTIDIRKFFENTKGYEPFLPYYVFEDPSDFGTFYFTDADGKKTASLRDFQGDNSRMTEANVYNKLYFPDPSFGGVFPKFKTQKDVWDFLIQLDRL